jgi:hypothetical protein
MKNKKLHDLLTKAGFKNVLFLKVILLTLIMTGCNYSCKFKEYQLTTTGYATEPHMVYNGTNYGILHYWTANATGWPEVRMLTVNENGTILNSKTGIGSLPHLYTPNFISNLVWNPTNRQFAFAYTKGKVLNFIRLDENLNILGSPLEIRFPSVDINSDEHPRLTFPSLVWNSVLNEYGLVYITVEHPYLTDRHDDVYISRISSSGSYVGPYARTHIVTCPGDCELTSVTYNTASGQYALSYIKDNFPNYNVMIGFLNLPSTVDEHGIMSSWKPNVLPAGVRVVYDPKKNNYIVVANKGEIASVILNGSGAAIASFSVKASQTYSRYFSVDNVSENTFFICAGDTTNSIGGWLATSSGHANDLATISPGGCPSAANFMHFAWIKDSRLYYGKYEGSFE